MESSSLVWETEIAALLSELSTVQQQLLDVLIEKRGYMAANDLDGMSRLEIREEHLTNQLEACHDHRQRLFEQGQGPPAPPCKSRMKLPQHQSLINWVVAQKSLLHISQLIGLIVGGGQLPPSDAPQQAGSKPPGWVNQTKSDCSTRDADRPG